MREISKPLRFRVEVTVPIVCNESSNDCNVIVRMIQDNSEIYLSLCSIVFKNGETNSHEFEVAAKRDFIYGRSKHTRVKVEVESETGAVNFVNHHKIAELLVSVEQWNKLYMRVG